MLHIHDNERIILTPKGLEQYYSHQENLTQHEAWFIEVIYGEHHIDNLIRVIIRYKAKPLIIADLVEKGFLKIVLFSRLEEEKKKMDALFVTKNYIASAAAEQNQGTKLDGSKPTTTFEAFDFERNDSRIESYVEGLAVSEITIMPYSEGGGVSVYSSGSTGGGSSSGLSESKGGRKISTKTPEVKAFEEIKRLLTRCVKEVFTLKSYFYSYQLSRVQNIAELNEFFTKIYQPCLDIKGKAYMEEVLKRIQDINDYYFVAEKTKATISVRTHTI